MSVLCCTVLVCSVLFCPALLDSLLSDLYYDVRAHFDSIALFLSFVRFLLVFSWGNIFISCLSFSFLLGLRGGGWGDGGAGMERIADFLLYYTYCTFERCCGIYFLTVGG